MNHNANLASIALLWVCCGAYNWGKTLGAFTCDYPTADNRYIAALEALTGPLGVIAPTPHGWGKPILWRPLTKEQRWDAYHHAYPSLSREDFEGTKTSCAYSAACPEGK